jgi:hypothetical protein
VRRTAAAASLLALAALGPAWAKPQKPKRIPQQIRSHDVAVAGSRAFLGRTGGLLVLDLSDAALPRQVGQLQLPATVLGLTLDGERALLAAGAHGLYVVDLSKPEQPRIVAHHDAFGTLHHAVALGHHVALAEGSHGVSFVDLRLLERPRVVATVATRGEVRRLALSGPTLATAEGAAGVRLLDVSRPDVPREIAALSSAEGARDVALDARLLLVAAGRRGVLIYGLTEPRAPRLLAQVPVEGSALALAPLDERNWIVARGGAGLDVLEVDPGGQATAVSRIKLPRSTPVMRATVRGTLVVAAADVALLATLDLTDPRRPLVLAPPERRMHVGDP